MLGHGKVNASSRCSVHQLLAASKHCLQSSSGNASNSSVHSWARPSQFRNLQNAIKEHRVENQVDDMRGFSYLLWEPNNCYTYDSILYALGLNHRRYQYEECISRLKTLMKDEILPTHISQSTKCRQFLIHLYLRFAYEILLAWVLSPSLDLCFRDTYIFTPFAVLKGNLVWLQSSYDKEFISKSVALHTKIRRGFYLSLHKQWAVVKC